MISGDTPFENPAFSILKDFSQEAECRYVLYVATDLHKSCFSEKLKSGLAQIS